MQTTKLITVYVVTCSESSGMIRQQVHVFDYKFRVQNILVTDI